LPTNRP